MTSYNIAVTTGPCIFRSAGAVEDFSRVGLYYDLIVRMIANFDYCFEGGELLQDD